jgi:hypothetical protein
MDVVLATSHSVPRGIRAATEIQSQVARFTAALDSDSGLFARIQYISLFDQDLERIRLNFQDAWTPIIDLGFLGAKLYLYAHVFTQKRHNLRNFDSQILQNETQFKVIITSGFAAAVRFVYLISQPYVLNGSTLPDITSSEPTSMKENPHWRLPQHFYQKLALAAVFLVKFLVVASHSSDSDKDTARNHLTMAFDIFDTYPNSKVHHSIAKKIEIMSRTNSAGEGVTNSRLGANMLYDALIEATNIQRAKESASTGKAGDIFNPISTAEAMDGDIPSDLAQYLNADWPMPWDTFFDLDMDFGLQI